MKSPYKILLVALIYLSVQSMADRAFPWGNESLSTHETDSLGPLHGRNQAPLLNLFYVMPVTSARVIGKDRNDFRVDFDISNIHERHDAGGSVLLYDMEIYRTSLHMTCGILKNLDVHLEIPALALQGGELDGIVQDYHELFGLPNGGREDYDNGLYAYSYKINDETVFDFPSHGLELADANADLKWQLMYEGEGRPAVAARVGIKIPTGRYDRGTGSGEFDFSFGMAASKSWGALHLFSGLDYTVIKVPASLRVVIDEDITHLFLGAEYELMDDALSLVVQLDGQNTPYVETGQIVLDNDVLEIVVGAKWVNARNDRLWQLSLREDLIHHSTVDFTLTFNLGARF